MTRPSALAFAFGKWTQSEDYLAQFSAPRSELLAGLHGKSVAIVGNARSLSDQSHGSAIDACDVVIRMHRAPLIGPDSHGTRTDWLALGMPIPQDLIGTRAPDRLLWMARKRKRLRPRIACYPGFYLHAQNDWDAMAEHLGAPPSTGVMIIDLVTKSDAKSIQLYGFDFFQSLSLSGRRTAAQVPHDFAAERRWVEAALRSDPRVQLNTK